MAWPTDVVLPNRPGKSNQRDRGIYGDAIFERCQFLLHENPKDLDRFVSDAAKRGLTIIDLLAYSAQDIVAMLSK